MKLLEITGQNFFIDSSLFVHDSSTFSKVLNFREYCCFEIISQQNWRKSVLSGKFKKCVIKQHCQKNNQNKSQFPEFPRIRQLSWFFILAKRVQIFRFVDFISFCELCKKYFVGWTVKSFVIFRVIFCFNLQRIVNSTTTLFSYLVNIRSNLSK